MLQRPLGGSESVIRRCRPQCPVCPKAAAQGTAIRSPRRRGRGRTAAHRGRAPWRSCAARKPVNAPRSMAVREFLRSNWHVVTIGVTAGAIVCAAVFLLSTMPPRSIAMATGPEGGGYDEIGRQYQALLARTGVELRLVATAGSVENLALLRDPHSGVRIALVQGGSVGEAAGEL